MLLHVGQSHLFLIFLVFPDEAQEAKVNTQTISITIEIGRWRIILNLVMFDKSFDFLKYEKLRQHFPQNEVRF